MKHSSITLLIALATMALGIFSMWFFPFNGVTLAGLILGTGFQIVTALLVFISYLLNKEGN